MPASSASRVPFQKGPTGHTPQATWDLGQVECLNREEFVVVGWTDPEGSRDHIGALLLGYYTDDGRLHYAGRAGTGITDKELKRLAGVLKPLQVQRCRLLSHHRVIAARFTATTLQAALGEARASCGGHLPDMDRGQPIGGKSLIRASGRTSPPDK